MRDDRGAASIFVLGLGLVLVLLGAAGATVGAARVARHQAKIASDFGALAGGAHTIEGQVAACAEAERYVRANGARMTRCVVTGLEIVVQTAVRFGSFPADAEAASRAGPISSIAEERAGPVFPGAEERAGLVFPGPEERAGSVFRVGEGASWAGLLSCGRTAGARCPMTGSAAAAG